MSVFDSISKKVSDTAKTAAKKSCELVEVTKLSLSVGTEEDKIVKIYTDIGKAIYDSYNRGEAIDEKFIEKCEQAKSIEQSIKEIKFKIQELKEVKECTNCGEELELDAVFCAKCGTKQE